MPGTPRVSKEIAGITKAQSTKRIEPPKKHEEIKKQMPRPDTIVIVQGTVLYIT